MGSYSYVAFNSKTGKEIKGSMDAESVEKVYTRIKADGLTPVDVKEQSVLTKDIDFSLGKKVKPRDLSVFCRQFVSIITAGVTIIDALAMLSESTTNKALAKAIKEVQMSIEKGETLSNSMAVHKSVFPDILVNMVGAGEASGSLEIAFERMAIQFEKDAKLSAMMKKAMVYPIIVSLVAVGVVVVMLLFVIPNFKEMFDSMDTTLPAITLAVVAMSDFLKNYWYLVILVIVLLVVAMKIFKKSDTGKEFFGNVGIKLPLFGSLTVKSSASRFARTLGTLLYAGLPLIDAIEIVAKTMTNVLFEKALREAKEEVAKGVVLSEPIKNCGLFPPMVHHMTKIGEETGNLEDMLTKLADYYDEEVEIATQTLMAALEPMIIIILALIVGVLIGAVMAPMLKMYTALDSL